MPIASYPYKNIRKEIKPNKSLTKYFSFCKLFLHEAMLQIKTFFNRFSFAPQDKSSQKRQEIYPSKTICINGYEVLKF